MSEKRYNSLSGYLKEKFGEKVYKITLDAGFTCPNRDGTISSEGCIFCDNGGSFSKAHSNELSVKEQIKAGIESQNKRFGAEKFLAYFQAYSNTYKPVKELRLIYDEALLDDKVVGFSIGTRPDCIDEEKIRLIASYAANKEVWLEFGMQTCHDKTLKWMNRGHDYKTFLEAVKLAKSSGIKVCAHVILGLPDESEEDMLKTAEELAKLNIDGVKFHALCLLKNTPLEKQSITPAFLSEDEYVKIVCDFLEQLPPKTVIHRLAGNGLASELIAPLWLNSKWQTLNKIDAEMEKRNSVQGRYFKDFSLSNQA